MRTSLRWRRYARSVYFFLSAAQTWGGYYLPETAMAIMYVVMGAVLLFRPWGLFGHEE